ncbi:response regulator transcription factor [uncultured Aurantimicrobium sp.]|jgi:two-component system invasion response regulator UvrY|uniref:response regulator transcription factor n=1 Tax=uncultured Aurantimicrobium sp. TaxID=1705357 RepID=UPI00262A646C|nr:response regulator transcription factor [uncultured Aurantimicrobium sp.]
MELDVLVVEDDNFTRITLASSLKSSGMGSVYTASTVGEAVELAEKFIPSAALIDLHLGQGPTGLDLARKLRALNPRIGIVILTSYDDPRLLGENPSFIPAGTVYLRKKDISDISVVTKALGSAPHSSRLVSRDPQALLGTKLSETQMSILKLVAEGHSNVEIARRRGVSEKAIEGSIRRLAAKLSLEKDSASNQRVHIARVYFRALGVKLDDDNSVE